MSLYPIINGAVAISSDELLSDSDGDAMEGFDLEILSHVAVSNLTPPLTGELADIGMDGWRWDRRRLESVDNLASRYDTYIGGHTVGLLDGTERSWWQSGTVSGIQYHDIARYPIGDSLSWTPRVTTGRYSVYFDPRPLYSDYSYSENVDPMANQNGVNVVELRDDAAQDTVNCAIWRREDTFLITQYRAFQRVNEFTGELVSGARLDTMDDDGNILWANLSNRVYEYLIDDQILYLNGNYYIEVGPVVDDVALPTADFMDSVYEYKGKGSPSGRNLFLDYFPVDPTTVRVLVLRGGVQFELTQTDSLNLSQNTDPHFEVDADLGIITLGGFQAENVFLSEQIDALQTTILCYASVDLLTDYPAYGLVWIEDELIYYGEKTQYGFTDCVRGYGDTLAVVHAKGSTVYDVKHGGGLLSTDRVYVVYRAVPRIDYEVTAYDLRSANGSWLNVNPNRNLHSQDVVQILSDDPDLAEIILETDSPIIGGNLFGPVFFGTDVSRLTATAYDSNGNVDEGVDLTIVVNEMVGTLNGETFTFTDTTNVLGQIYSIFNVPFTNDAIRHRVTDIQYSGADTILTIENLPTTLSLEELVLFQILKYDKMIGSTGLTGLVSSVIASAHPENGAIAIIFNRRITTDYEGGLIYILGSDSVKYIRTINKVYDATSGSLPVSLLYLDELIDSALTTGSQCWLYLPEEEVWDPNRLNGALRLVYEWRPDVQHPLTGELGAYFPLEADSRAGADVTYLARHLPVPAPTDPDSNLGGYVAVAPIIVSLYARGQDPISGKTVVSNTIRLLVDLPNYLVGVDRSGALPIPYGFTFITEEFNVATGIGGSNFLTVNPRATGIDTFSILAEV